MVSERVDPYVRRKKIKWEKHDELRRVVRQEKMVEEVIRPRTWAVIVRRCHLEGVVGPWEEELSRVNASNKKT
jgi:Intermembrane space protein MIX23